jgi:hypothetical protein
VSTAVVSVASFDVALAVGVVAVSVSLFLCLPLPVTLPDRNEGKTRRKQKYALELIKDD